jgi:hypothetical protein
LSGINVASFSQDFRIISVRHTALTVIVTTSKDVEEKIIRTTLKSRNQSGRRTHIATLRRKLFAKVK